MIDFCILVFGLYALGAVVKMLIDYTLGVPCKREQKTSRRRPSYEKTDSGICISKTQRADKAYF
ncbi:MAG: hypothetical protein IJ298_10830 [Ruminococcus sp.]|nr:hypothetical protein [Ruminococcus sp.]